jgi:hypothetical protein
VEITYRRLAKQVQLQLLQCKLLCTVTACLLRLSINAPQEAPQLCSTHASDPDEEKLTETLLLIYGKEVRVRSVGGAEDVCALHIPIRAWLATKNIPSAAAYC